MIISSISLYFFSLISKNRTRFKDYFFLMKWNNCRCRHSVELKMTVWEKNPILNSESHTHTHTWQTENFFSVILSNLKESFHFLFRFVCPNVFFSINIIVLVEIVEFFFRYPIKEQQRRQWWWWWWQLVSHSFITRILVSCNNNIWELLKRKQEQEKKPLCTRFTEYTHTHTQYWTNRKKNR